MPCLPPQREGCRVVASACKRRSVPVKLVLRTGLDQVQGAKTVKQVLLKDFSVFYLCSISPSALSSFCTAADAVPQHEAATTMLRCSYILCMMAGVVLQPQSLVSANWSSFFSNS